VNTAEIGELLHPYIHLDGNQLEQTLAYINLLVQWNARVNLTSVRREENIVTRHFGESFFAAEKLLNSEKTRTAIDLGSGAGFPGLPLAMLAPEVQVTLIESQGKKAAFLNEVIRALNLKNVTVFKDRGEEYAGKADLVTMRAVEKFGKAAELASHLLTPGGRLALMIGESQLSGAQALKGLSWQPPIPVPGGESRILLVGISLHIG
jgi:16S rRNA (guanine527-N7)-methyltransferase